MRRQLSSHFLLHWLPKPWLLKGEAESEYWQWVYDRWMEQQAKIRVGIPFQSELEISPEVEAMIEEDRQFWDYRDDIIPDDEGELPRWKYSYPRTQELFDWLPWGKPGSFHEVQAMTALLMEPDENEIQILGKPQVSSVETVQNRTISDTSAELESAGNKPVVLIVKEGVDSDESGGTVFWGNMASSS